jgi:hypothetical protein
MSVVTIPSTSSAIRVGDSAPPKLESGANTGGSPSSAANQIADLAWGAGTSGSALTSISFASVWANDRYPRSTPSTQVGISDFAGRQFRKISVGTNGLGRGTTNITYPFSDSYGTGYSTDINTYPYVTIVASVYYPFTWTGWYNSDLNTFRTSATTVYLSTGNFTTNYTWYGVFV